MIAVIFEVEPREGRQPDYLALAATLAEELRGMDGFISVERFASLSTPGKLLSLSIWRDEAALAAWRNLPAHRAAQRAGRAGIFAGYRIRVAQVLRDYTLTSRAEAPPDSRAAHG
jgi:heme-degrading monooxygenase HmoA